MIRTQHLDPTLDLIQEKPVQRPCNAIKIQIHQGIPLPSDRWELYIGKIVCDKQKVEASKLL